MKEYIYDIETNPNYFLLSIKDLETNKVINYEIFNDEIFTADQIIDIKNLFTDEDNLFIGFNSSNFDMPIIKALIDKKYLTAKDIKYYTEILIGKSWAGFEFEELFIKDKLYYPPQIDLYSLLTKEEGTASGLKIVAGRIHSRKLEEMPHAHDKMLTRAEAQDIKSYCINDLNMTADLYQSLLKTIRIREDLSDRYDIKKNIKSKGDATVAEITIKEIIEREYNIKVYQQDIINSLPETYIYEPPKWLKFKTQVLKNALKCYQIPIKLDDKYKYNFEFDFDQAMELEGIYPNENKDKKITSIDVDVGETSYTLAVGGIHSNESNRIVRGNLQDIDVASYYPACILNNDYVPSQFDTKNGNAFKEVFKSIVDQRLEDKKVGKGADLKIVINGAYGKFKFNMPKKVKGKYVKGRSLSALYAPHQQLNVCITGQLALLMLIENFELNGIPVISANTDGLVIDNIKPEKAKEIIKWWEDQTGFVLEPNNYKLLVSTSVNSYFALTEDDKIKRKGADFLDQSAPENKYTKEPKFEIIKTALIEYFVNGTPVEDTIRSCTDITQFLKVGKIRKTGKKVSFTRNKKIKVKLGKDEARKRAEELRSQGIKTTIKEQEHVMFDYANPNNLCGIKDSCVFEYNADEDVYEFTKNLLYRFYYTTRHSKPLVKSYNGDAIPESIGAKNVLNLPDTLPTDIDYQKYIDKANLIINSFKIKSTYKEDRNRIYERVVNRKKELHSMQKT